jgi:hypothetical protein
MFTLAHKTCVFALAAAGLYAQTVSTPPPQVTLTSGIVSLAEGQTAQLNALNPGVAPPAMSVVCSALVTIIDGQGKVLKAATVAVPPGASRNIDVDSDKDLALHVDERRELRATLTIPPILPPPGSTVPQPAPCKLIGDLEIVDTVTGRPQVVLGIVHLVPSPTVTPTVP